MIVSEKEEMEELMSNIHQNDRIRFLIFGTFLVLGFLLDLVGIRVPLEVMEIIGLLFLINIFCELLAKKVWSKQSVAQTSLSYFIFQIIEIASLLILISVFDAVLFGGIGALMIYVVFSYLAFTRITYPRLIAFFSGIGYIITGLLEHFGITEYRDFYHSGVNLNQNRPLFIVTTSFMMGFFIFLVLYGDIFSKKLRGTIKNLREKTEELTKKETELREAKQTLEIRVEARTRELKEIAKNLDEQVKKRTGELQEKVQELEKFQKIAVGRELKMIELKKKIRELEEELKKYKGRK
jgi:hypothetical protein